MSTPAVGTRVWGVVPGLEGLQGIVEPEEQYLGPIPTGPGAEHVVVRWDDSRYVTPVRLAHLAWEGTAEEAVEPLGYATVEPLVLTVECVEFGNDRLDALEGWQGTAWAVCTPGGEVLGIHLTEAEAQAVVRAYNPPPVLTLEPVAPAPYVLHYVSEDPGVHTWSVYREHYVTPADDEPIDGSQVIVSTGHRTRLQAEGVAQYLQARSNPGS